MLGDNFAAAWKENSGSARTSSMSSADGSTEPEIALQKVPDSGSTAPGGIPQPSGALCDARTSFRLVSGVMRVRKAERMPSCSEIS